MAWRVRGSWGRVIWAERAGDRVPGRFHFTLFGLVLMGLAGFLWAPGGWLAASPQQNAGVGKAGATGGVQARVLRAEEMLISTGDLLFIQVYDVEQMTREYRVSGTGTVDFPLLAEPVLVADLTPQQAAEAIAKKCREAGVLSRPQISVTIRESRAHAVAVSGAVRIPQIYPVLGRISLLDILTLAGGVVDDAGSLVTITRGEVSRRVLAAEAEDTGKSPPAQATVTINLQRLLATDDPSLNVDVYPGDRVTVQRAGIIYVVGAVSRPGGYLLTEARQDMTVLKAIALAGYLSPFAKGKKALLLRPNASAPNGHEEITINVRAMLKGNIADRSLVNNDILFVPDSSALKALHRGADIMGVAASYAAVAAVVQ